MIYCSTDLEWAQRTYPRLQHKVRDELIKLLAEFIPDAIKTTRSPRNMPAWTQWCFPFVGIADDFDHENYEIWTELAEAQIRLVYKLSESDFCDDPLFD